MSWYSAGRESRFLKQNFSCSVPILRIQQAQSEYASLCRVSCPVERERLWRTATAPAACNPS